MTTSFDFAAATPRLHNVNSNDDRLAFADVRACPSELGAYASKYNADKKSAHFYEEDLLSIQTMLTTSGSSDPDMFRLSQFFDHCLRGVRERGEDRRPTLSLVPKVA